MNEERLCRPGGFSLTEQLYGWIEKEPNMHRILDIGCGAGDSMEYMGEKHPEWEFFGIDPSIRREDDGHFVRGTGESLPWPDHFFDAVVLECSFSRLEDPKRGLSEIRRVLRKEGTLLISDLYLRGPKNAGGGWRPESLSKETDCRIGRLETAEQIRCMLRENGFHVFRMIDVSKVLGSWVAQQIMDGNGCRIDEMLGMDLTERKKERPGYFLLAAEPETLTELVSYAGENSSFYRKRYEGYAEKGFFTLPLTDAEDLRMDPESLLCVPQREIARIITLKSSGSQGLPKRIFFTEEDLEATADFFEEGIRWLVRPGDRVAVFMEGPTHYSVGGLLKEGLSRLPASVTVCGFVRDYAAAAEEAKGMDTLIGIPAQMYRLAKEYPELRPRTVLLSADNVPDAVKRCLEETWGCVVFSHWGMSETGYGGGVQCSARAGYHMRDRHLLLEILDPETGRPVPDGETGEVVVTTMHRRGMPLIRYRTGDLGYLISEPCSCGCLMPRLGPILGRLAGGIRLPDGEILRLPELDEMVYEEPILGYQSRWNEEDNTLFLHLWEDIRGRSERSETVRRLKRKVRERYGNTFTVAVDFEYNKKDYGMAKRRVES